MQKIGFIGGGNMAQALIVGMTQRGFSASEITVIELDADKRQALTQTLGVRTDANLIALQEVETIVLAVKPQQLKLVAQSLVPHLADHPLIISIAAGIRIADIRRWLNGHDKIIRTMPNTPAQIQAGITGLYAAPAVSKKDMDTADQILSAVGETIWLRDESQLDAVTAISGSGPAYVFYMIEALQEAGVSLGLTPEAAAALSLATFKGASLLAANSPLDVTTLRAQVTSKGGTTEQAILSFEESRLKEIMMKATLAAANRAKSLADELGD